MVLESFCYCKPCLANLGVVHAQPLRHAARLLLQLGQHVLRHHVQGLRARGHWDGGWLRLVIW